jgi:hypothetical protein
VHCSIHLPGSKFMHRHRAAVFRPPIGAFVVLLLMGCSASEGVRIQETRSLYQCIGANGETLQGDPALPPLIKHPELSCAARHWKIPRSLSVAQPSGDHRGFRVTFPPAPTRVGFPPVISNQSVRVVGGSTAVAQFAHRRVWFGKPLVHTGEHFGGLPIFRSGRPDRFRYIAGDSFVVVTLLKRDGPFSVDAVAHYPRLDFRVNRESEGSATLQVDELHELKAIERALREQLNKWSGAESGGVRSGTPNNSSKPTPLRGAA